MKQRRQLGPGLRRDDDDEVGAANPGFCALDFVAGYSSRRSGAGLGLALAREFANVALRNREGGGLSVALVLPVD
jgi:signal transduction histidine kinase